MKNNYIYLIAATLILLPMAFYIFLINESAIHLAYLIMSTVIPVVALLYSVNKNGLPRSSSVFTSSVITYLFGLISTIGIIVVNPTLKMIGFVFVIYLLLTVFLLSFAFYSISILPETTRINE